MRSLSDELLLYNNNDRNQAAYPTTIVRLSATHPRQWFSSSVVSFFVLVFLPITSSSGISFVRASSIHGLPILFGCLLFLGLLLRVKSPRSPEFLRISPCFRSSMFCVPPKMFVKLRKFPGKITRVPLILTRREGVSIGSIFRSSRSRIQARFLTPPSSESVVLG